MLGRRQARHQRAARRLGRPEEDAERQAEDPEPGLVARPAGCRRRTAMQRRPARS